MRTNETQQERLPSTQTEVADRLSPGAENPRARSTFIAASCVIALLGAMVAPIAAQNLILNPDFASDLDGWETTGMGLSGTWSHDPATGATALGSAHCVDNESCIIQQCVDVSALQHPANLQLSGTISHDGSLATVLRAATVFDSITCSGIGQTVLFTQSFFPPTGWTIYSDPFETLASTQAIIIQFAMSPAFGGGPIETRLDDASLAPSPVIFSDGFESGNTSAWSASTE